MGNKPYALRVAHMGLMVKPYALRVAHTMLMGKPYALHVAHMAYGPYAVCATCSAYNDLRASSCMRYV